MSAFFLGHPKETDLALFAGGESGPFARWRIERHVERCPQCQEIAADFFRLPDQLNGLADLPNVDWKQMAMAIESGVRADAAAVRPANRTGFPPLVWQAGLVAATVVAAVIVARYPEQPQAEPELIALAPIKAPVEAPEQAVRELGTEKKEQDAAAAEPSRSAPAEEAEAPLAKARAERQTFASDIAAPAAPPPPPQPAVLHVTAGRRAADESQPVAPAAESAEGRLRSDAASRVGAVAALSAPAAAANEQAGFFRQANVAWTQLLVEAVNLDDAPISLSGASATATGGIVKTPGFTAQNRADRTISGFELIWIVRDADASATARVERRGISIAPGAAATSGGEQSWRLPAGITAPKMLIYVASVSFEDGTTWSATAAEIASRGLIEPGAAPQLELLPLVIEPR